MLLPCSGAQLAQPEHSLLQYGGVHLIIDIVLLPPLPYQPRPLHTGEMIGRGGGGHGQPGGNLPRRQLSAPQQQQNLPPHRVGQGLENPWPLHSAPPSGKIYFKFSLNRFYQAEHALSSTPPRPQKSKLFSQITLDFLSSLCYPTITYEKGFFCAHFYGVMTCKPFCRRARA